MSAHKTIGTSREKSLHASLKLNYAHSGGRIEVEIDQYVCDAVRADGSIVEVQTGNFGAIRQKIIELTKHSRVILVHPVAASRTIELRDTDGNLVHKRKSPRKGSLWNLFSHLVYAPLLPLLPNFSIEVVLVDESELRSADGNGSWRRKGASIVDRQLEGIRETIVLSGLEDYKRFLPANLPEIFTVKDLAVLAGTRITLAGKALYVLKRIGLVEEAGKKGNAKLYRRA